MRNNTEKLPILEEIKPQIVNSVEASLLVNGEIGSVTQKFAHVYKKYSRKHIAQYALTVGNRDCDIKKYDKNRHVVKNYEELRSRQSDLKTINVSLCNCGISPHYANQSGSVEIKEKENTRRLKGLKSCGSNSACPVCAAKLSAVRGNQLNELMQVGRDHDRSYMMIVATIPHSPGEELEITLNQVIDMSRYIFKRDEWRDFKKITKCRFVHGGLENMVSFKNGKVDWHPHKNYLLDFDISTDQIIKELGLRTELDLRMYVSRLLTSLGQKFLDLRKINKKLLQPFLQQDSKTKRIYVKAAVSATLEFSDDYIAKWGLDAEMTAGIYKDGSFRESFHPFLLLDFINQDNKEVNDIQRYQCIKAFQEFVLASKGKWWFYFAKGAVAYYNEHYGCEIKVKKDKEELLSLEDDGENIYTLNNEEWEIFEPTAKKIGEALSKPTRQEVLEYIFAEIESNRIKYLSSA